MLRRGLYAVALIVALAPASAGCTSAAAPPGGSVPAGTPAAGASAPAGSSAPAAAAQSFAGTWSGTWTRKTPPPGSGTYTWVLHQNGNLITGTLQAGQSLCLTHGPLTGQVAGNQIIVHVVTPAVNGVGKAHAIYHGVLSGNKLSGTGIVTCSVGTGLGTWQLTRQ